MPATHIQLANQISGLSGRTLLSSESPAVITSTSSPVGASDTAATGPLGTAGCSESHEL
jgi:hypothetical protein